MADPRDDLGAFLGRIGLFADLSESLLADLAGNVVLLRLAAGDWLFRQGEATENLYVVCSGRIEVLRDSTSPERVLRVLGPGEVVGELAFLTHSPRAASGRARRDCELVCLGRDQLNHLLSQEQGFALALLRLLGRRLQESGGLPPPPPRPPAVIAVIGLGPDPATVDAVAGLGRFLEKDGPVRTLGPSCAHGESWGRLLDEAERGSATVIVDVSGADDAWREFGLRQADRVLAVVDPSGRPSAKSSGDVCGADVVFTGRVGRARAVEHWLDWIEPRAFSWADGEAGLERAFRRLLGGSTGLVLSGGGARGLAHLGAVSALQEVGGRIDQVGGCSMGALVGAMVALGWEPERMIEACRSELVARHPFRDYTVPRTSLIKARRAEAMLHRLFGDHRVEHLPVPFFAVSADLISGETVVHRTGALWEAVGASMCLPGLAPPYRSEGRLLVDGGIVNNLPVDVMVKNERAHVIAVDVMRRSVATSDGALPPLLETISRAATLGSWALADANRATADVLIAPEVADIGLLEFDAIDRAVAAGRMAASAALAHAALP